MRRKPLFNLLLSSILILTIILAISPLTATAQQPLTHCVSNDPAVLFCDDFNGTLDAHWNVLNNDASYYTITSSTLELRANLGDLHQANPNYKNLFVIDAPVSGDWQITMRVIEFIPDTTFAPQLNLVAYDNDGNFVRDVYGYIFGGRTLEFGAEIGGTWNSQRVTEDLGTAPFYLRLVKVNDTYTQFYSVDGNIFIQANLPLVYGDGTPAKVGFVAMVDPNEISVANIDWFEVRAINLLELTATLTNSEVYPEDLVTVNLNIQDANNLYAAESTCAVNPAILEPQSGTFGDFFDPVNRLVAANIISPTLGTWFGAISQQNPAGPLSGDGLLATLTYQALTPGTTAVTCDPIFSDRNGFTQTVAFMGADITVLPYATITGTAVYQGRLTHAGIEAVAAGLVTSTDVTDADGNFTLAQLRTGTYTVTADAASYLPTCTTTSITSGETIPLTTTTLHGGDVNDYIDGGWVINIGDATLLTSNFGLNVPTVNPPIEMVQVDINADGVINVQDLAILAGNYEQAGCQDW